MKALVAVSIVFSLLPFAGATADDHRLRVLEDGDVTDARLKPQRGTRDAYHPWTPPTTKEAWERKREAIRERILVSNGLWLLPPKTPLEPVVHGKIDKGDYTVEKVYFASRPGHYVSGNLYRPKNAVGKRPGILCPHGHWASGRFYDAGEAKAKQQIEVGAESRVSAARYPLQARMVQLVRMGCVVFHYDMVGYADSRHFAHWEGFADAEASLRLQNTMGIQTFNSIRALDFLTALPDVDAERIGVTGASGGGTQTFILAAVDPRPAVVFPAVMVSTGMQGGCVCENADYLRIGLNNIAFAAMFAPKPMAMSGADDWTKEIMTKGLPELKQVYALYGPDKASLVDARADTQFKHNYNQVSRRYMYGWMNRHLNLQAPEPIEEKDFEPLTREQMSVFDADHPRPADSKTAAELREAMTKTARGQFQRLLPHTPAEFKEYREVVGAAARVLLDSGIPPRKGDGALSIVRRERAFKGDGYTVEKGLATRTGSGERVPFLILTPAKESGRSVVWIEADGKSGLFGNDGQPKAAVREMLESGVAVVTGDVFRTGEAAIGDAGRLEFPTAGRTAEISAFTFGYNRPLLSNRVRDILTLIALARDTTDARRIDLVGGGKAGPWVLLAAGAAGDAVTHTVADAGGFTFSNVQRLDEEMMLPGALKYGGLGGLASLAAASHMTVAGMSPADKTTLQTTARAAGGTVRFLDSIDESRVADVLLDR